MIHRKDITNTLPVGILEDGEFTPDSAGLAVRLCGYYTVGELLNIVDDLKHVDAVYKDKRKTQEAAAAAFESWSVGGCESVEAAKRWAEHFEVNRWAVQDLLSDMIQAYFKKHNL